ncbi:hypothetical protein EGT74_25905 [Chitinophaga lutea]|uniref:Uncharacterized protein n=1 Tax=Chitinophaga lutea TaxID=2488634 RepID=A0A3N4PLP2_9BACT|nr:hypothetical protein [Chitinophaga lutea]RPE05801.1 hypothetical protein EGT74_25905 [Chitinophaga lutea]
MKKISIILMVTLSFWACKKDGNNDSPSNLKNTVTYTTNGKTYTVSEGNSNTGNPPVTFVDCFISKSTDFTRFWLHVEGDNLPFNLFIDAFDAPPSGIGTFIPKYVDWNIQEKFSDGQPYKITAGAIKISEASNTKIEGTYSLKLDNSSGTKNITGTFSINQPVQ